LVDINGAIADSNLATRWAGLNSEHKGLLLIWMWRLKLGLALYFTVATGRFSNNHPCSSGMIPQ
jgi:hypothetical protein